MAKRVTQASDNEYLKAWLEFRENFKKATPVDLNETHSEKLKRIAHLEANREEWFKYYFPHYYKSEPADFQLSATERVMTNLEWFETRAWSRELAKTSRNMMETTYQVCLKIKKCMLYVSNSSENAERLLLPYKTCFESNQRLINDYGQQEKHGSWKANEFTTQIGGYFRALGWGESPRGAKNEEIRPDKIVIDDIDTDEECRNEEIMENKIKWIEQALFPTRSISEDTQIIVLGNIIHESCIVKYLGEMSDHFETINIRDENGRSTWPQKNSEKQIDRVLKNISYESGQKEYFNNPMDSTKTFKNLLDKKVPVLRFCDGIVIYADPATSNKDTQSSSMKSVGIIARKGLEYYLFKVFLDNMTTASFIDYLFESYLICKRHGLDSVKVHIENNTLQNPFYEQVLLPAIYKKSLKTKVYLPITPDTRKKGDKYQRIEARLEPLDRNEHMFFNADEAKNPNMIRCKAQFKAFRRKQKRMDGPDMFEGGVAILQDMEVLEGTQCIETFQRTNSKRL